VDLQFSQWWICRVSLSGSAIDLLCICFRAILQMSRLWLAPIVVPCIGPTCWSFLLCIRSRAILQMSRLWLAPIVVPRTGPTTGLSCCVYAFGYPSDEPIVACADCGAYTHPSLEWICRVSLSGSAEFPWTYAEFP